MARRKPIRPLMLSLLLAGIGVLIGMLCLVGWRQHLNPRLILAIRSRDTAGAISLLAQGANANAKDRSSDVSWFLPWLWDNVRGKRTKMPQPQSALLIAVYGIPGTGPVPENLPLVRALLDHGADVNARNEQGTTALMSAAADNYFGTATLLLERGAEVNLKDEDSVSEVYSGGRMWTVHTGERSALQYASEFNNVKVMELLLQQGADANTTDYHGGTLLMHAAAFGEINKIHLLIHYGANVNAQDKYGITALMGATSMGHHDIISLLHKHGADVNLQDDRGETALMRSIGIIRDNPKTLRMLLKMGADFRVKSHSGQTVLNLVRKKNYTESMHILQQAGAKE